MKIREIFLYGKERKFGLKQLIRVLLILFFAFFSITVFLSPIAGILFVLLALLWIPAVNNMIYSRIKIKFTTPVKVILSIVFLLIAVGSLSVNMPPSAYNIAIEFSNNPAVEQCSLTISNAQSYSSNPATFTLMNPSELKQELQGCEQLYLDFIAQMKESYDYESYLESAAAEQNVATELHRKRFERVHGSFDLMIDLVDFIDDFSSLQNDFQNMQSLSYTLNYCEAKISIERISNQWNESMLKIDPLISKVTELNQIYGTWSNTDIEQMEKFKEMKLDSLFAFLSDAFDGVCILQTLYPKINPQSDYLTITQLTSELENLELAKEKLESATSECKNFFIENPSVEISESFNYGTCFQLSAYTPQLDLLIEMVKRGEPEVSPQNLSETTMFVTIYNYNDLLLGINPLDPNVRSVATQLAKNYPGDKTPEQAKAVFEYVRDGISYVQTPLVMHQRVQTPPTTLQLQAGNCADKSILLASMFISVGFPVKIVLQDTKHDVSYYQLNQVQFSPDHAYVGVYVAEQWYSADTTCSSCALGEVGFPGGSIVIMDIPLVS